MDNQGGYSRLLHTNQVTKELGTIVSTGDIEVGEVFVSVIQISIFQEFCVILMNPSEVVIIRTFLLYCEVG